MIKYLIPAAISSQLDDTGEERIHMAPIIDYPDTDEELLGVQAFKVYELDKGWTFDGYYIPHFVVLNWYFGEDPFTDKTVQKVRVHGLTKGHANLKLSVSNLSTNKDYEENYTEAQLLPLPRAAKMLSTEFIPVTNYVDTSNWGIALQMRFEGSNTDLTLPEPAHVLQVLAFQTSPRGSGHRIN